MISSAQLLRNAKTTAASEHPNAQVAVLCPELPATTSVVRVYRHNPYGYSPLKGNYANLAEASLVYANPVAIPSVEAPTPKLAAAATDTPAMSSAGFALPIPASVQRAKEAAAAAAAIELSAATTDDALSEASSEVPSKQLSNGTAEPSSVPAILLSARTPAAAIRYASVNFRFGSAWFIAPFRTTTGDMVVVEYPGNSSLHMGIISEVTTRKPTTFFTEDNTEPNYLSLEEMKSLPHLLRHARDFDKHTKMELRQHDLRSLQNAQLLAANMKAPVNFLDAEWLLDLSAVTFLVNVYGDVELVDRLADELAAQEAAEVVFTYPSAGNTF